MKKWYGTNTSTKDTPTTLQRVNASLFPLEWKQNAPLGEAPKVEMTEPMGPRLPRVKITVHSAKNLDKKCFIKIRILQPNSTFLSTSLFP